MNLTIAHFILMATIALLLSPLSAFSKDKAGIQKPDFVNKCIASLTGCDYSPRCLAWGKCHRTAPPLIAWDDYWFTWQDARGNIQFATSADLWPDKKQLVNYSDVYGRRLQVGESGSALYYAGDGKFIPSKTSFCSTVYDSCNEERCFWHEADSTSMIVPLRVEAFQLVADRSWRNNGQTSQQALNDLIAIVNDISTTFSVLDIVERFDSDSVATKR